MTSLLPALLFAIYGLALFYLVAKTGFRRYEALARRYPLPPGSSFPGKPLLISPDFGRLEGSRNGIRFWADARGFYLEIFWLFRFGRRPAFVPWEDVALEPAKVLRYFDAIRFKFRGLPDVQMTLYARDWKRIQRRFGPIVPGLGDSS